MMMMVMMTTMVMMMMMMMMMILGDLSLIPSIWCAQRSSCLLAKDLVRHTSIVL
jgi:hypothetical protein